MHDHFRTTCRRRHPAPVSDAYQEIITPEALDFVVDLQRTFNAAARLCSLRDVRQICIDAGEKPDFLAATKPIREASWTIAPIPSDLLDRRVEITGPFDRKMIINALNCGAKVFMADFEDSCTPTWNNLLNGQINLRDMEDAAPAEISRAQLWQWVHHRANLTDRRSRVTTDRRLSCGGTGETTNIDQ